VKLEAAADPTAVEFRVIDDGPGIDPADRERIFEPGERGAASGADGDGGAGLGLPLARRLARAVDGDVDYLESASETVFRARLPLG
jgi:signal transduction histidine kinase